MSKKIQGKAAARFQISMDRKTFQRLERGRSVLGISRSSFISQAIARWWCADALIRKNEKSELTLPGLSDEENNGVDHLEV